MTQTNITIRELKKAKKAKKQLSVPDLYALYLETSELVRNRPDAVCTPNKSGRGKSIFQRKLVNIKRYAAGMKPRSPTEKVFLEAILGREVEKVESRVDEVHASVKVEWFQLSQKVN